ncbi:MAG: glycoside hydrolase family 3 C-terminal domain-containing protein [Bacteroidales bacterium]
MKKPLKILGIILLSLIGLVLLVAVVGAVYVNGHFLSIDSKDKYAGKTIESLTVDGLEFLDLNRNGELDPYEDTRLSLEERSGDLILRLTPEEKLRLLKGTGMKSGVGLGSGKDGVRGAVGSIPSVMRLGLPTLYVSDGPAGLRISPTRKNDDNTYYCTAFPIGTLLASTWNTELVEEVGMAMGNEVKEYGIEVILGPGANIHRNPLCGRNFEYYSEDPLVTGKIGAAMVNGVESNGVGTSVKHFVANNQETNRNFNDVQVSDRAFREIYLKGFEIIVKESQPWTIMSSYNLVNGTYASQSREILTDILRNDWGFEGLVMTDWFGGQDAPAQVRAGNDLQMPGTRKQANALKKAAASGELAQEDIDTSVKRILSLVLKSNRLNNNTYSNRPDLEAHAIITRQSASEGMVLLKNEGALPLSSGGNIALFGGTSYDFIAGGTGSGDVNEAYTVSLEEGLRNAGFTVNQEARGVFDTYKEAHPEEFEKPEGLLAAMMNPYSAPEISFTDDQVRSIAQSADLAVYTIGRNAGEGGDRVEKDDFLLSEKEQAMLDLVCETFHAAGKLVVVVMNIGGVIETASWKDKPDAILLAWQGGQEGGNSVADILSGTVNPSGKLPMTFPVHLYDHASSANFPMDGIPMSASSMISGKKEADHEPVANVDFTRYEEGIYVGYRHFDKQNLAVSYPFGFGLSYTDFALSDLTVVVEDETVSLTVQVQNTGAIAGKEVVQIYASKPGSSVDRPVRELKAFAKTPLLQAGESVTLTLHVPVSELCFWDETMNGWSLEPGTYALEAGNSSRNLVLSSDIPL